MILNQKDEGSIPSAPIMRMTNQIINRRIRGKAIIPHRLVFGGGYPRFRFLPKIIRWGRNLSLFWLGTELVWLER